MEQDDAPRALRRKPQHIVLQRLDLAGVIKKWVNGGQGLRMLGEIRYRRCVPRSSLWMLGGGARATTTNTRAMYRLDGGILRNEGLNDRRSSHWHLLRNDGSSAMICTGSSTTLVVGISTMGSWDATDSSATTGGSQSTCSTSSTPGAYEVLLTPDLSTATTSPGKSSCGGSPSSDDAYFWQRTKGHLSSPVQLRCRCNPDRSSIVDE